MVDWRIPYNTWRMKESLDSNLKEQLDVLKNNDQQLKELFYTNLAFGTGGIRGILGPGTNRLNIYTIRKVAEGMARHIVEQGEVAKVKGVVIAYDCRFQSPEFAMEVAKTLGFHGIHTYMFNSLRPTPELSFAVRYLQAFAGVMITASHNPPEYNGLKVYGEDGGQIVSDMADSIVANVNDVENELDICTADECELKESGLLKVVGDKVDKAYLKQLLSIVVNQEVIDNVTDDFTVVYTPFHGTGTELVMASLQEVGFKSVHIVDEQALPDPTFSTVNSPNPEEHAAFDLAIEYGEKHQADVVLGTDPDADRMGVVVKQPDGTYHVLTGNQVGALMLHYLVTHQHVPKHAVVLKTIVTSELGREIAEAYGVKMIDTLTGFKYISERIKEFELTGEYSFLLGYEESCGYLIRDFARDKDAIQACLLLTEIAAYYKTHDMTLYEGLLSLFEQYGYYKEGLDFLTLEGSQGQTKIESILNDFRNNPPSALAGMKVVMIEDYKKRERHHTLSRRVESITLPESNVLKFKLEGGAWFCVRPSGTEPKIKFYFGVRESTMQKSKEILETLKNTVMDRVNTFQVNLD